MRDRERQSLDERIAAATARPRLNAALVGGFAGAALLVAALGVYGMLSHSVSTRAAAQDSPASRVHMEHDGSDSVPIHQELPLRYRIVPLTVIGSALACLAAALPLQEPTSRKDQAETIRRMLIELHENDEFTGGVLMTQSGIVIYRDAITATPGDHTSSSRVRRTSPRSQSPSPQWR